MDLRLWPCKEGQSTDVPCTKQRLLLLLGAAAGTFVFSAVCTVHRLELLLHPVRSGGTAPIDLVLCLPWVSRMRSPLVVSAR